jgi:hypothetical protein
MTDFGGPSNNLVPAGFTPIVLDQPSAAPDIPSVGATPVTNETRELSPEELQQLQAAFDFILITTGGIVLGYSTAAAGWTILGQAAASGTYSGVTTYLTSDENVGDQTTRAAIQDFAVGLIPVPPPAQAAISIGINKIREQIPEPKEESLSSLQRSFDPRYAW